MSVALLMLPLLSCGKEPAKRVEGRPIAETFEDTFERAKLGDNYFATTANYQLVNGAISAKGAYNHPLWLTRQLPDNVSIEFDCWSNSPSGDIKVEFFGDGESHAPTKAKVAYKATGFIAVMGGWGNSKSILAWQDEHGRSLSQRATPKVEVGKRYHWKLVRRDGTVDWFVDDMSTPFLQYKATVPMSVSGRYFGINNWESDTWFDNLRITPL